MHTPQRDPFRHPGVADEIEAQLQMQEERRSEAARLAKVEADLARLAAMVRWGIFGAGTVAVVIALAVAAYLADAFPRRSATPMSRPTEPLPFASLRLPGESALSPSQDQLPLIAATPSSAAPDRAALASGVPAVAKPASASIPPRKVAAGSQPASFTTENAAPNRPVLSNPVTPPRLPGTASLVIEYKLKAAFLIQFANYVKWPPHAFSAADTPFTIGILGDDPFGDTLEKLLGSIQGRPLAIRRSREAADLLGAQMVFISKSERANIASILGSFAGTSTLTVGETEGFTTQGGMIEFTREGDKIRFRINPPAAQRAGLQFDGRLTRLAAAVEQ